MNSFSWTVVLSPPPPLFFFIDFYTDKKCVSIFFILYCYMKMLMSGWVSIACLPTGQKWWQWLTPCWRGFWGNNSNITNRGNNANITHWGNNANITHWGSNANITYSYWGNNANITHCGSNANITHWGNNANVTHWGSNANITHWGSNANITHWGNNIHINIRVVNGGFLYKPVTDERLWGLFTKSCCWGAF